MIKKELLHVIYIKCTLYRVRPLLLLLHRGLTVRLVTRNVVSLINYLAHLSPLLLNPFSSILFFLSFFLRLLIQLYFFHLLILIFTYLQGLTRGDGTDPDAEVFPEQRVIRVDSSRDSAKEASSSSQKRTSGKEGRDGRDRRDPDAEGGRVRVIRRDISFIFFSCTVYKRP